MTLGRRLLLRVAVHFVMKKLELSLQSPKSSFLCILNFHFFAGLFLIALFLVVSLDFLGPLLRGTRCLLAALDDGVFRLGIACDLRGKDDL